MIFTIGNTGFEHNRRNIMANGNIVVSLGDGSYIDGAELHVSDEKCIVTVGKYTSIGRDVKFIIGLNHDYTKISSYPFSTIKRIQSGERDVNPGDGEWNKKSVIIGSDVWIGTGVTILGGVRIGHGAIIGAGTVVAKNVPAYAVVVGNPGKVIKYRFEREIIKKLEKIKWWNKGTEWIEKNIELLEGTDINCINESSDLSDPLDELEILKKEGYRISYVIPEITSVKNFLHNFVDYLAKNNLQKNVIIIANKIPNIDDKWTKQLSEFLDNDSVVITVYEYARRNELVPYIDEYIFFKQNISFDMLDDFNDTTDVVYYEEIVAQEIRYIDGLDNKKKIVDDYISDNKYKIKILLDAGKCKEAMHTLSTLGNIMYEYNQSYTDEILEEALVTISNNIFTEEGNHKDKDNNTVLFYDGFGLDRRGLANIYLDALVALGYRVVYVTIHIAKNKIPTVEKILNRGLSEIFYLPDGDELEKSYFLSKIVYEFSPACGFLYTTPNDVAGIVAFMHFKGNMKRFLINLTDHAFWLGKNALDYCLEYRDYGASISSLYRGISKDKLIRMNFYPAVDREIKFAGFPFDKEEGDFVIFSGGWLYKTFDNDCTYYRVVEHCLQKHPQVKFWYAGYGDNSELLKLMEKYPGRVFYTGERKDLFQVMQNIDIYLDTYPVGGGLMMQYSAVAGRVPLILKRSEEHTGCLENRDELGIEFNTVEAWMQGIDHFILDDEYRHKIEKKITTAVCTRADFIQRISDAIVHSKPSEFKISKIDNTIMRTEYLKRFIKNFVKN